MPYPNRQSYPNRPVTAESLRSIADRPVARPAHQPIKQPPIGYLMKSYPKISETFILNEILELERQGVDLHLFSLRPSPDVKSHPDVAQVQAPVTYIPKLRQAQAYSVDRIKQLIAAQWHWLRRSPQAYGNAWNCYQAQNLAWEDFLQAAYLAQSLEQLGIKHLQVHFANLPTAIVEVAQQFYPFSFNIFAHAKDIYLTPPAVLDRRIAKAEFVLTCTGFNAQHLRQISTSETPIVLSYHGINFDRFTPNLTARAQSEVPLFISVGRFCEKKGFPYLLQACQQLKQAGHVFRCMIIGYGEMQAQLLELIELLDLSDVVTLPGKKTQDELVEIYNQASLFVLPCLVTDDGDRDGIPNVLLEAMAMELPIVSTDISGIAELVEDQHHGFLVPEKNSIALAAALAKLLAEPQRRQAMGQQGRQKVLQQFNLERNVGEIVDLFAQVTLPSLTPI
jgi:glycosyltransferase involved in cell wall biosynthesis